MGMKDRKIEAEAATPCLAPAWIRLSMSVTWCSGKAVTGLLRSNAQ